MLEIIYYSFVGVLVVASLGGIAYYLIAVSSARRLASNRDRSPEEQDSAPPITLLKPLMGIDPFLEENLEGFFRQNYPSFEILFAVRDETDPAVKVVQRLVAKHPQVSAKLVLTGEPPYANAKVYSLEKMAEVARHSILVITDSDASVGPDYLSAMARAFAAPGIGAATNLYRGIAGDDFWSKLEALGMSTEFMAGVVVAERLEGMKFLLGPSMAIRVDCLQAIGGFAAMSDYLADDFVMGHWAAEKGFQVALSTYVINHHASSSGFTNSFKHRLRWNRSTRFSRPSGYFGQGFTYGLPWAMALFFSMPASWSLAILLVSLAARMWLAIELGRRLLQDKAVLSRLWLVPLQDALSFAAWVGGFTGREIVWRNERYRLLDGGRFRLITSRGDLEKCLSTIISFSIAINGFAAG